MITKKQAKVIRKKAKLALRQQTLLKVGEYYLQDCVESTILKTIDELIQLSANKGDSHLYCRLVSNSIPEERWEWLSNTLEALGYETGFSFSSSKENEVLLISWK
jgi:hypothetical protein